MTTIFISGSREIRYVPEEVKGRIDKMADAGFDIVVGDSERGVDAAVLRYLESCSYDKVTIYTIHDRPRVKSTLDSWDIRRIVPCADVKTDMAGNVRNRRELETAKDQAMGEVADYGLVIWQSTYTNRFGNTSVSKGSLRNMYQLLGSQRPVVLYKASISDFDDVAFRCYELRTPADLNSLVMTEPDAVRRTLAELEKTAQKASPSLF